MMGLEAAGQVLGFGLLLTLVGFLLYGSYRAGVALEGVVKRWWRGSWRFPVAEGAILTGVALAVWGALSFEPGLTGTVGHPIVMLSYPAWAKVAIVGGCALIVGGVLGLRGRKRESGA